MTKKEKTMFDEIMQKVDSIFLILKEEKEVARHESDPCLLNLKTRFEALPPLHKGVQWAEVEKALKADPESKKKLMALDEKGHEMNVFGKKEGKIIFRTAQTDIMKMAAEHRTIMYDKKAQTDYPLYKPNGNAEDIAASMGVELADPELYKQFLVQMGWMWVKTDPDTRKTGYAFLGRNYGIYRHYADDHYESGSFCAALRVNEA